MKPTNIRKRRMSVHLTDAEADAVKAAAERAGKSVSDLLRDAAISEIRRRRRTKPEVFVGLTRHPDAGERFTS